ncbi:MAG: efflux RND transporter permease subunit [Nostoc sp.]|uniref:efflux RND transporter permease subunit n=1 Tax=Nostoc sp. TaxID=1180 RepID=UPI002FF851B8
MIRFTKLLQSQAKAIYLIFVLIALLGIFAYNSLPSGVYPELSFPRITAIAEVGNLAPEEVALTVTRPLEEATNQVYGVERVRSKTARGSTELSIEFQLTTDMQQALQQLEAKINEVRSTLPSGVNLTVERVTPAIFPVLSYNFTTDTLAQTDLYTITQYQILPRLTRVAGVARVNLQGGNISEVEVQVDPNRLQSYGLNLSQVADTVQRSTQNQAVGKLDSNYQQNLLVTSGQPIDASALTGIVVTMKGAGKPVFLQDLAQVSLGETDPIQIVSAKGKRGLTLNIFRQPNSNVVAVTKAVQQEIKSLEKSLPPGVQITKAYDESGLVVDAIANVRDAIAIGIVLIIIVLYVFLREWRSTVIASITIPLSALAAFGVLSFVGQSLNLMSLGGLAVAIGLVIDDAIVVIENIDRQLQRGLNPSAAVAAAMAELTEPVISSTITTVAVFIPLGLLSGVAGQFFTSLTITLTAAVVFSLLLALTLTPLLGAKWLRSNSNHSTPKLLVKLDNAYTRLLRFVFGKVRWVGAIALFLLAVGAVLFTQLGSDFLPAFDEGSYIIDYLAPPGTSLTETDLLAHQLEEIIAKTPEITTWTRRTGAENGLFATQPNKGDIVVVLKSADQRQRKVFDIIEEQRQHISAKLPQLNIDFHQILQDELDDLSGAASPVEVRIFGEDPIILRNLGEQVQSRIEKISGLVDLASSGGVILAQLDMHVNPTQAVQLGLTASEVAQQVQDGLFGRVATQIRQGDRLVDVRVHLLDTVRRDPQQLNQIPIVGTNGATLPLSAVATIKPTTGEEAILRENQQRYVSFTAGVEKRDLGSVVQDINKKLAGLKLPQGYILSVGGLIASQQASFSQLLLVMSLGVLLVYLVLVLQFRDLLQPLVIFTTIPLALLGVILGLWITQTPLNVSSFMGIILLVGLVVKNGIILLEYTNRLRSEGQSVESALIEAGRVRLRPILMTTLCTILGLLPLALGLGAGAELQKPLAIAVIGGLSLSTIFTLIFVPIVFRLVCRLRPE